MGKQRRSELGDTSSIYLWFIHTGTGVVQDQWYVIEEKGDDDEETAEKSKSKVGFLAEGKTDRLRQLHLPKLDLDLDYYDFRYAGLAVSRSGRLYIIGGVYSTENKGFGENGILFTDSQQSHSSWEKVPPILCLKSEHPLICGGARAGEEEDIYAVGLRVSHFRFREGDTYYKEGTSSPLPDGDGRGPVLLLPLFSQSIGQLRCYDRESWEWCMVDPRITFNERCTAAVSLGDSYMISFGDRHPVLDEYSPGLYVYDLTLGKWLPKPVQGLPNDGVILPKFIGPDEPGRISESYVMHVRRDLVALVWVESVIEGTRLHWSKLRMKRISNPAGFGFEAELVSSGIYLAEDAYLTNCTAGGN